MIFTALIFFFVLSILVVIHELGHFVVAKLCGVKVEEFGFGIPPRIFGIRRGETLYSLNLLPFGGFVKVFGEELAEIDGKSVSPHDTKRSFAHKPHWQKVLILCAGVTLNFVLGWAIISYLFTRGVPVPSDHVTVQEVTVNSPAAEAGIEKGDIIVRFFSEEDPTQHPVKKTSDVSDIAKLYAGENVGITLQRGDQTFDTSIVPRENPPEGQGAFGIAIAHYEIKKYTALEAPFYGLIESARITATIAQELIKTLVGLLTLQKPQADIAGPIGIAQISSDAAKQGMDSLLQVIGLLSLNLAVLNILPFPALDGGRLMFVLYEWITGKRVKASFEQRLNFAGFAILISLLILVTVHDIIKLAL